MKGFQDQIIYKTKIRFYPAMKYLKSAGFIKCKSKDQHLEYSLTLDGYFLAGYIEKLKNMDVIQNGKG